MGKTYWIIWGTICIALYIAPTTFPLWFYVAVVSLVIIPAVKRRKNKATLESKIDLLAKQAGIQYGTTEEKLEQLNNVRQNVAADKRDPWDRA